MKFIILSVALVYAVLSFGQTDNELKLPISYVEGYGPFAPDFNVLTFRMPTEGHAFYKAYNAINIKGIPSNWKNIQKGLVFINPEQWVYQNYHLGNISSEVYKQVIQEKQIDTSLSTFTQDSIGCIVFVLKGVDEAGTEKLLVDYNNNADFSDETAFVPQNVSSTDSLSTYVQYAKKLTYQVTKSSSKRIPFLVLKKGDEYIYSFPQYALSTMKQNGKVYKIAVSHKFRFPSFWDFDAGIYSGTAFNKSDLIKRGEFITIENTTYSIAGINISKGALLLKKHNFNGKRIQSSQIGFSAIQFLGKDILSDKAIGLSNYKGKYVFINFWGSWCSPCIAEMPHLKTLYAQIDPSKIDFIGVAGNDNLDAAKKVISDKGITWSNILSDNENLIVEKYHNLKYPTGFLIDPNGKILANDISSYELETKLKELRLLR